MFLKSSVSLNQEIKCDKIIDFIRILYTVKEIVYSTEYLRKTSNNNFAKMVSRHYGIDFDKGILLEFIDDANDEK